MQSNILADMFSLSSSADRYKKMYSGRNGDQLVDEASISCSICYDYDYSAIIRYLEHFNLWDAEGGIDIVIQTDEDCRKMEEFISSYGERVSFDGAFCVVDAASGEVSQAQADPDAIQFLFLQKYPPPKTTRLCLPSTEGGMCSTSSTTLRHSTRRTTRARGSASRTGLCAPSAT